jgi:hypothetical protein
MAVTLVASSSIQQSNGTSITFAYTTGSGSDRLLVLGTNSISGVVNSASYGGVAMTAAASVGTIKTWTLVAPASGNNNFTVVLNTYNDLSRAASDWIDVDQSTPTGTAVTATGSSGTASSGSVTCPSNGAIHGWHYNNYTTSGSFTPNSGTTILAALRNGGGGQGYSHSYRTATGTVDITLPSSASWQIIGLPLNAVAGGTTYNQSISGSITGSGLIIRNVTFGKGVVGSLSASGTVNKRISRGLSGAVTGSGSPFKASSKQVQGSVAGVGILSASTGAEMSIAGSIAATGAVARAVQYVRSYSAAITMAGTVTKRTLKSFSGTIQAIGTMGKGMFVSLAGSITASGILSSLKFTPTVGTFVTSSLRSIRRFIGRR